MISRTSDMPPNHAPAAEAEITRRVLDSFARTPDARLRALITSLVRHLHGFAREVGLTPAEWERAIDFLTRTGQTCTATRQEFILLSDTLGLSMLVDAVDHRADRQATETTVLGPFYADGAPVLPFGADIAGDVPGEALLVEGKVNSNDRGVLGGAILDVWQSDAEGFYDAQKDHDAPSLRARFATDAEGRFRFRSIVPSSYPIPDDGPVGEMLRATARHPFRPAHIHFRLSAPGHETLTTQIFVAGDRYLDSDAVFGVKDSLVSDLAYESDGPGTRGPCRRLRYDFILERSPAARMSA